MSAVVAFESVEKSFRLGERHASTGGAMLHWLRCLAGTKPQMDRQRFAALEDVSFEVKSGEAVGVIGPNGAGKSTVLKLAAGVLRADRGTVRVKGRLAALIEVGAGFHGDLTGRENIFLNGAILGMSRAETRRKLDDIVAFAGVERFLDTPVKRYSSGMYARLGFSIAAHVEPEVLLVDEVLSVGDAVFRLRCMERMRSMLRGGTTLVFVTHDLEQMQSVCDRTIVLNRGRVSHCGTPGDAVHHYLTAMCHLGAERPVDLTEGEPRADGPVSLTNVSVMNPEGRPVTWATSNEPLEVEVEMETGRMLGRLVVELNLRGSTGYPSLSFNSGRSGATFRKGSTKRKIRLSLPGLPLGGGHYFWNVRAWDADSGVCHLDSPFRFPLLVQDGGRTTGSLCIEHQWSDESHPDRSDGFQENGEFSTPIPVGATE